MGTTVGRAPSIDMNGDSIAVLGGGGGALTFETDYSASVSLQKLVGKHTLKTGWEHRRYYTNQYVGGSFYQASDRTVTQMNPLNFDGSGSGYASFLLGNTTWGGGNQWSGPASLQTYHAAYFQDDIKLTNKLTVNAGIRWEFEPPRTERYNREIFWDSKYKWNIQPAAGWSWQQDLQQADHAGAFGDHDHAGFELKQFLIESLIMSCVGGIFGFQIQFDELGAQAEHFVFHSGTNVVGFDD